MNKTNKQNLSHHNHHSHITYRTEQDQSNSETTNNNFPIVEPPTTMSDDVYQLATHQDNDQLNLLA